MTSSSRSGDRPEPASTLRSPDASPPPPARSCQPGRRGRPGGGSDPGCPRRVLCTPTARSSPARSVPEARARARGPSLGARDPKTRSRRPLPRHGRDCCTTGPPEASGARSRMLFQDVSNQIRFVLCSSDLEKWSALGVIVILLSIYNVSRTASRQAGGLRRWGHVCELQRGRSHGVGRWGVTSITLLRNPPDVLDNLETAWGG